MNEKSSTQGPDLAEKVNERAAEALLDAVVTDGFDPHSDLVAAFVSETQRLHISDVLAAVTLDRHQPLVARERALGRLVAAYCRIVEKEATAAPHSTSDLFTVAA